MQINSQVNDKVLVEESQLGVKLGHCVHDNRRNDFALMLAMLVEDVRFHSQFSLPQTRIEAKTTNDEQLRKEFSLAKPASLSLNSVDEIATFSQASLVEQQLLASMQLDNALKPKAIAFRDDKKHIPTEVMMNTSIHCQQKHQQPKKHQRLPFNVNAWLKAVQTTIVKAPLINIEPA